MRCLCGSAVFLHDALQKLEAQFDRAGFAPDPQRPTIIYDVDADPIPLGPVVDQPDHVIVMPSVRDEGIPEKTERGSDR
jgi:hypothetical protein